MTRLDLGLVLSAIIVLQLVFAGLSWKQLTVAEKLINLDGLLFLWLSSPLFPWNFLATHFPVIQTVQFPQRFNVIALTMIILATALSVQKFAPNIVSQKSRLMTALFLSVAGLNLINGYTWVNEKASAWQSDQLAVSADSSVQNQAEIRDLFNRAYDQSNVFSVVTKNTPDYLPVATAGSTTFAYDAYKDQILNNPLNVKKAINAKSQLTMTWQAKNRKQTLVPVIVYKHSTVRLNGRLLRSSEYQRSNIGVLIVEPLLGKNTITVGYKPSKIFWIAVFVNVVTIACLLLYGGIKIKVHLLKR